ncbi:hypothetical protein M0804_008512 [Polistes exclamans]|nr:hypothetical protein M0804_008512 [Polistes exclamans]
MISENVQQDETMNIIALKDTRTDKTPAAICVQIDQNNNKKRSSNPADGQDVSTILPSSTLATCRQDYPSGCTILECRLDAFNRPVAQILQVPPLDSDGNSQKMGLYVEAKHTPSGPYSRVTSCPIKDTCEPTLRTYALESGQIFNDDECSVSKILYEPMRDKIQISDHRERCPESTEIQVECVPTRKDVEEYDHPNGDQRETEILESIINPKEYIYRSPPNCVATCTGAADKFLRSQDYERRNGLDSTTALQSMLPPTSVDLSMKKPNRICPARCCKPLEKSLLGKPRQVSLKSEEECRRDTRITRTPVESLECPTILRKYSKDAFSLSASQDSLERYKDYISKSQLDKYRACRSKRNGLQDECFLPIPRALLELEKREQCHSKLERNEDQTIPMKRETTRTCQLDHTICT